MYCYFNNGFSMRAVDNNYTAKNGEVLFDHEVTEDELAATFVTYASSKASQEKEAKIAILDDDYDVLFTNNALAFITATRDNNANLIKELNTERDKMRGDYKTKLEAIMNG